MALGAWFMARSISELKCWVREKTYTSCHSLVHASYIACHIWHPVLMCALDFWLHAVSICCAGATNVNDIDWTTRKNTAFADHLLKTLGKGAESCQGIQEAAQCVVEESNGNCSELTKRFARIGTSGTNPQNCERDLFRLINLLVESWLYVFLSIYIYVSTTAKKFDLSIWPIIAQGSSFCHHPCERQDQEESCQISTVPSHPTSWGCASYGIHWSISCWFSRLGLGGDDAKHSLAGSKVIIICMNHILFDRKCRRESHRGKTPMMVDSSLVMKCRFFLFGGASISWTPTEAIWSAWILYLRWHGHQLETTSCWIEIRNFIGLSIFGSDLSCHSMVIQWHLYE